MEKKIFPNYIENRIRIVAIIFTVVICKTALNMFCFVLERTVVRDCGWNTLLVNMIFHYACDFHQKCNR